MKISKQIKDLETQAHGMGISTANLCKKANIHRATFQRWKAGKNSPLVGTFEKLQAAFRTLAKQKGIVI